MIQRGAIFGLDARLALAVGGIMALALSSQMVSQIRGDRVTAARTQVLELREALVKRFSNGQTLTFDTNLTTLATSGYLDAFTTLRSWAGFNPGLDPWGNALVVRIESGGVTRTVRGYTLPIQMGFIVSAGPDGTFQSTTTAPTQAQYEAWLPAGDDIGLKFNTLPQDLQNVALAQERLRLIAAALETQRLKREQENDVYCDTLANQTGARCDVVDGTNDAYYTGEEMGLNYYPLETADTAPSYTTALGGTARTSGNVASMENFLDQDLGLPINWVRDPWGRVLRYNSNVGNRLSPPYFAMVWYE